MKIGNLEVYGVIYKIENLINNKCYIGQTIQKGGFDERYSFSGKDIERVYKSHKNYKKTKNKSFNRHLFNSIEKYGFDNFSINKLFDFAFSKEELDIKENTWIDYFDCINKGYNWRGGGSNGKLSEETKKKISESNKGEKNANYGNKWSEEQRKRAGEKQKNRKHTEEAKKKISDAFKGEKHPMWGKRGELSPIYGIKRTKEEVEKMSLRMTNDNPMAKECICLNTNEKFKTLKEGAIKYNRTITAISYCCKRKTNSCGKLEDGTKLVWCYYNDYIKMSKEEIINLINIANKKKVIL